jgi:hypothetical protein
VDVQAVDPAVNLRSVKPVAKTRLAAPAVDVRASAASDSAAELDYTLQIIEERLTAAQMRRAVVMSEILRPPLAMRGSPTGGWDLRL